MAGEGLCLHNQVTGQILTTKVGGNHEDQTCTHHPYCYFVHRRAVDNRSGRRARSPCQLTGGPEQLAFRPARMGSTSPSHPRCRTPGMPWSSRQRTQPDTRRRPSAPTSTPSKSESMVSRCNTRDATTACPLSSMSMFLLIGWPSSPARAFQRHGTQGAVLHLSA